MSPAFPPPKKSANKIPLRTLSGVRVMNVAESQLPLFHYIQSLVGRGPDAEDLFQEVHLRFQRKGPATDLDSARPWLFRVARNLAYDLGRRRLRRRSVALEAEGESGALAPIDRLAAADPAPPQTLEAADLRARIQRVLDALPESQREVAVRRLFHGMAFREVAQALDIPLGTALGRFHAAAKALRRELGDDYA